MEKRMTMKELAKLSGVSLGAVHSALYDKPGVSKETKEKILQIAKDNDYRLNTAAASLKRKPMSIAVVIPAISSVNRYYFNKLWAALNDYKSALKDYNISFIEIPYYIDNNLLEKELIRRSESKELAAVIAFTCYMNTMEREVLKRVAEMGIAVVLVGEDSERIKKLCSILPDYTMTGRMVAELMAGLMHRKGKILICAGNVTVTSHYMVVEGLQAYFEENENSHQIIRNNYSNDPEDYYDSLIHILSTDNDIIACFAVTARESVILGKALEVTGKAGQVIAIGSDIFDENLDYLSRGVFTNLLNKNPYTQMASALKYTVEHLIRDITPSREVIFVGTEIVFKSNIPMFMQSEPNRLLL